MCHQYGVLSGQLPAQYDDDGVARATAALAVVWLQMRTRGPTPTSLWVCQDLHFFASSICYNKKGMVRCGCSIGCVCWPPSKDIGVPAVLLCAAREKKARETKNKEVCLCVAVACNKQAQSKHKNYNYKAKMHACTQAFQCHLTTSLSLRLLVPSVCLALH